jgi:hypothetical protein
MMILRLYAVVSGEAAAAHAMAAIGSKRGGEEAARRAA